MKEELINITKKKRRDTREGMHEVLCVPVGNGVDLTVYRDKDNLFFVDFEKEGRTVVSPVDFVRDSNPLRAIEIRDGKLFYYPEYWCISVPIEKLRKPRNIFGLLHELGHLQIWSFWEKRGLEDLDVLMDYKVIPSKLSNEEVIRGAELELQNERDAWAAGLRMAKKLRDVYGIDLFKLFKNNDELMGWLRVDLLETYEAELQTHGGTPKNEKQGQVSSWLQTRWEEELAKSLKKEIDPSSDLS